MAPKEKMDGLKKRLREKVKKQSSKDGGEEYFSDTGSIDSFTEQNRKHFECVKLFHSFG